MMRPEPFSEEPYHEEYLKIRGVIRHFSQGEILEQCYQFLQKPVQGDRPDMDKQSWVVFLLIKWAYLDEGPWQGRKLDAGTLGGILARIRGLVEFTRLPSQYESVLFFFRTTLFQQDSFQKRFTVEDVARQLLLFNGLESTIDRESFLEKTGISIEAFFDFAFITCGHAVMDEVGPLNASWFSTLNERYSAEDTVKFLDTISVAVDEISQQLAPYAENLGSSKEFHELTPFINFPLIKVENAGVPYYLYLNKNILFRSLGHFAFDFLKRMEGKPFSDRFGDSFEKYVCKVLEYYRVKFKNEAYIKSFAPKEKVADFFIQEFDCNIYIDAKASEMPRPGKVAYEADHVRRLTRHHVRKAITQCNSAARVISREVPGSDRPTTFAIVLTYKEMYLGNGERFIEMIGDGDQLTLQAEFGAATIPPENVFFLSISDFERLICGLKKRKRRIGDFLKMVRRDDRPGNKKSKMFFSMHLGAAKFNSIPDYLFAEYEAAMNRVTDSLLKGEAISGPGGTTG
jgi:hypothetical protein